MNEAARPWVKADPAPDGRPQRQCLRHKVTFLKNATCTACDLEPGAPLDEYLDKPMCVKPPTGCMSTEQLERWFVALAKKSASDAEALAKAYPLPSSDKKRRSEKAATIVVVDTTQGAIVGERVRNFHDDIAISKYRDVAIKAARAATELAERREDEDLVRRRGRWIRDRDKGAAH